MPSIWMIWNWKVLMRLRDGLKLLPGAWGARQGRIQPYKVLLSLTDRCNHRCQQCRIWERTPRQELSPDELAKIFRRWPGLRWVDLTGGEPTLRPDLDAVADAVKTVAPRLAFLHFATNGSASDQAVSFAHRLKTAKGPHVVVTVSIDGDQVLHDQIRGRSGAFESAVETTRRLARMPGVDVYVGTTVTPDNKDRLYDIAAALHRFLPDIVPARWHINVMQRSSHFFGNNECADLNRADVEGIAATIEALKPPISLDPFSWVEFAYLRMLAIHARTGQAPIPCRAVLASVFVATDGSTYPCHIKNQVLGNLRDVDYRIDRLLAGPQAIKFASRLVLDGCNECWTPCEAYPAMVSSPLMSLIRTIMRGPNR